MVCGQIHAIISTNVCKLLTDPGTNFSEIQNQDINIIFFQENAYENDKCKPTTYACIHEL